MNREEQIKAKAKEWIRQYPQRFNETECRGIDSMKGFEAGALWADANPVRSWIRTKDRLPEATEFKDRYMNVTQSRDVLIDLPGGAITIARLVCQDGKPIQWECFDYTYPLGLILHWMELPAYPKYIDNSGKEDPK